jgi:hypothetical protein
MLHIERTLRHGVPELLIDGQVASRVWARPDLPGYLARDKMDQYREAGIDIHLVSMHQPALLFWDGADHYDARVLEAFLRPLCEHQPRARFIIYLGIRTAAPYQWCRAHPEELTLLSNGDRFDAPSVASEVWKRDSAVAIAHVVRHLESTDLADRVLGYNFVMGGNEWFAYSAYHRDPMREGFADYSEPMHARFRAFVRDRYHDDEAALRSAWRDPSARFDTVRVPSVDQRLGFGHEGLFFNTETQGFRLRDFYHCWHRCWAEMAEHYCRSAKEASSRTILCGLMNGYSYCGALAGYPQISNYGGARHLLASPWVDFFQSPYHYLNRSFPGVHFSQHASDSVLLHGKLLIDQIDTKTHLKTIDGGTKSNARTPWQTEQVLKRDAALSLTKNSHCYWMEISHGIFRGFAAPMHFEHLHFDSPEISRLIADLKKISDQLPALAPTPVSEIAWFASKENAYHLRPDHYFEHFFLDGQRQWQLPHLGAPFDDYIFEDFDAVTRDYKLLLFPNANAMDSARRRAIRARIEAGAHAVFWYAPGYADEHGCALENCRELTGLALDQLREKHWLHVELDPALRATHPLLRGVSENDYGSDIEPAVLNRTQEWMMFPGDRIDHYRFNPVFHCVDPEAEVLGRLRGLGLPGLVTKAVGRGRVYYTAAPFLPASLLRNIMAAAGVHCYAPGGDLVYANDTFLGFVSSADGPRELRLPRPRRVSDALTGAALGHADRFTLECRRGETRLLRLAD